MTTTSLSISTGIGAAGRAACVGRDPRLWQRHNPTGNHTTAITACRTHCPDSVRRACGATAFTDDNRGFVRGGFRDWIPQDLAELRTYLGMPAPAPLTCRQCGTQFTPLPGHPKQCLDCSGLIDAAEARDWLEQLRVWGVVAEQIATALDISVDQVKRIRNGRTATIGRALAADILALTISNQPTTRAARPAATPARRAA